MKLNMKTLCSIGALALCAENLLAIESNVSLIRNENESTCKMVLKSSDFGNLKTDELSSITKLKIEGDINSDQLGVLSNLLQNMPNLKGLDLGKTGLKEVPSEVFDLEKLEILDLSWNSLTDIASKLTKMRSLQELYLQGNQITQIPNEIENLENLRILNVKANKLLSHIKDSQAVAGTKEVITGEGMPYVCLHGLDFSYENKKFFVGLAGWTSVPLKASAAKKSEFWQEVAEIIKKDVDDSKWKKVVVSKTCDDIEIHDIKTMTSVYHSRYDRFKAMRDFIVANVLSKTIPDSVYNLTKLESVELDDGLSVSAFLPLRARVAYHPDWGILGDTGGKLTFDWKFRYDWKGTKILDLSGKDLSQLPLDIVNLENLERLNLSNNQIEVLPKSLGNLKKLKSVNLSGNPHFDSFDKIPDELLIGKDSLKFTLSVNDQQVTMSSAEIKNNRAQKITEADAELQRQIEEIQRRMAENQARRNRLLGQN